MIVIRSVYLRELCKMRSGSLKVRKDIVVEYQPSCSRVISSMALPMLSPDISRAAIPSVCLCLETDIDKLQVVEVRDKLQVVEVREMPASGRH